jgi:DNA topoisomerase IA
LCVHRPDKYAAMSVDARREMDLKIGVAFSRLMTRAYLDMAKEKFRLRDQKVISFGPCQTPTLWFCVQRHREIQNFRPEEFFTVTVTVNVAGRDLTFSFADSDRVTSRQEMSRMEAAVKQASNQQGAVISSLTEERKIVKRPVGLTTVTLLSTCTPQDTSPTPELRPQPTLQHLICTARWRSRPITPAGGGWWATCCPVVGLTDLRVVEMLGIILLSHP